MKFFQKAVRELGSVPWLLNRGWLLPDGSCLDWPDGQDHRWCGQWCRDGYSNWYQFIEMGAASIHHASNYIHIRTSGLTCEQRMCFQKFFEETGTVFVEAYWQQYKFTKTDFRTVVHDCVSETMKDSGLIYLRLTDTVGYEIGLREFQEENEK